MNTTHGDARRQGRRPVSGPTHERSRAGSVLKPGETAEDAHAANIAEGVGTNAVLAWKWSGWMSGNVERGSDLEDLFVAVSGVAERVKSGDLGDAETMLAAQIVSLNAMFANLALRAHQAELLDPFERYLRLALKAQAQCRATAETLAVMRNPPVFAKQANVVNGPQQVNQTAYLTATDGSRARAGDGSEPIKVLGEGHGERLDTGATGRAGAGYLALAPVAAFDGTANAGGQSAIGAQRVPRRGARKSA